MAQVYQALRMEVNDKLGALRELLTESKEALRTGRKAGGDHLSLAGGQTGQEL
jgi:hypothetical protein